MTDEQIGQPLWRGDKNDAWETLSYFINMWKLKKGGGGVGKETGPESLARKDGKKINSHLFKFVMTQKNATSLLLLKHCTTSQEGRASNLMEAAPKHLLRITETITSTCHRFKSHREIGQLRSI